MYDSDACDLIDFAKEFAALGSIVGEQVEYVIDFYYQSVRTDGTTRYAFDDNKVNSSAIVFANDRIGGMNIQVGEALRWYLNDSDIDY